MSSIPDTITSGKAASSPAQRALLCMAFFAGFSLPLARAALVVTLILTLRDVYRGRRRWCFPATAWAWLAYFATALLVTAILAATNKEPLIIPAHGLRKTTKLLWYFSIPVVATLVDDREQFRRILVALALGTLVEALGVLFLNVPGAWLQMVFPTHLRSEELVMTRFQCRLFSLSETLGITERLHNWIATPWRARSYNAALAKLAGMATAQRLMCGFLAALGLWLHGRKNRNRLWNRRYAALVAILLIAFVLALKRGPWISAVLVVLPLLAASVGWRRSLVFVVVVLGLLVTLPAARERLAELPDELTYDKGGRALMWFHIVPCTLKDHPWGVGFRGLTNRSMRRYSRRVEMRQNHVHSNPLQVLIELSWPGLLVYLIWMSLGLRDAIRLAKAGGDLRGENRGQVIYPESLPLTILAAMLITGITEYNFLDGELVLIYGLLMGLAASGAHRRISLPAEAAKPHNIEL